LRNSLILTVSMLLLPEAGALATPVAKAPVSAPVVSVKISPKPNSVRDVGDRSVSAWRVTITVSKGSHAITVTHSNAADPAAQAGVTHVKTWTSAVSAGQPDQFEVFTWGDRPIVGAKIDHSMDVPDRDQAKDPPANQPSGDQPPPQPAPSDPPGKPPEPKRPPLKPGRPTAPRPPAPSRGPGPSR